MARLLWSAGGLLLTLGIAALVFGWDTLLWLPTAVVEIAVEHPETYGLIAGGIALMVLARALGRRS